MPTNGVGGIINSILINTMKLSKIILTLQKGDIKFLTNEIRSIVINKKIELITISIDFNQHIKYFRVQKKYRDYAIITIDDDIIYTKGLIESLYNSYIKNPNCIHSKRVHIIMTENNKISVKNI